MTDSIQLYDVKVVVRSALKLLPEIKCLLSSNPNRLNLFRRTVFGSWLDLPFHYNDNHLMHYVLQHHRTVNIVDEHWQHHLDEKKKNPNYNATYNLYGLYPLTALIYPAEEESSIDYDSSISIRSIIVDVDGKPYGDEPFMDLQKIIQKMKASNVHEERIANLERLLKEKLPNDYAAENTKPNMIPNYSDDISSCSVLDLNSNQTVVDALIQACTYVADHPELDVLQHEVHVDRSRPKINHHPMIEPLTADEFPNDYMSVLNDEEMIPNVSLDDMKFQHEEENFHVKDTPLEHQPVDELIDAQKDTTNLLPEKVKKRLAMAFGSPYGQLRTTTPAPLKSRSMTSIRDTIVAPEFEVHLDLWVDLMWSFREPDADWAMGNRRPWWRNMKRNLPQQLTSYLNEHGVLASKGISVEQYEIKYVFPNVVSQADDSGDCGVWVCIFLYQLSCKQPLAFKDPIQIVLAYHETMLQYFWNHKFAAPKSVLMNEGVKKLTVKVKENAVHVSSSSSSKPFDIDLNESMSPDQDMVCPNTPHKFIPQYRFRDKTLHGIPKE
ncbi:phospholipase-like protein [Tanacetum coccineum]